MLTVAATPAGLPIIVEARNLLDMGQTQEAYRILNDAVPEAYPLPDDQRSNTDTSSDDAALVCVICHQHDPELMYQMEAEGRWANLAPGARIICGGCFRPEMGRVESSWGQFA